MGLHLACERAVVHLDFTSPASLFGVPRIPVENYDVAPPTKIVDEHIAV
jgi:hypothetical protein